MPARKQASSKMAHRSTGQIEVTANSWRRSAYWIAYHLIDNPMNAKFAAVNFVSAGLRIFDIRNPEEPTEVAYVNHGFMIHGGVGHYDAARGLIYAAGNSGLWIPKLQPQVRKELRLPPTSGRLNAHAGERLRPNFR